MWKKNLKIVEERHCSTSNSLSRSHYTSYISLRIDGSHFYMYKIGFNTRSLQYIDKQTRLHKQCNWNNWLHSSLSDSQDLNIDGPWSRARQIHDKTTDNYWNRTFILPVGWPCIVNFIPCEYTSYFQLFKTNLAGSTSMVIHTFFRANLWI